MTLDTWNKKQMLYMENGGNHKAHEFFRKNGVITGTTIDYKNSGIQKYKQELNKKVKINKILEIILFFLIIC